jgi:hypothetical protein
MKFRNICRFNFRYNFLKSNRYKMYFNDSLSYHTDASMAIQILGNQK